MSSSSTLIDFFAEESHTADSDTSAMPSSSQFARFLDECGSSLQMDAEAFQDTRKDLEKLRLKQYPRSVQLDLEKMRSTLPQRAAYTVQMLRRCVALGLWSGGHDCEEDVGLTDPRLCGLFDLRYDKRRGNAVSDYPLRPETSTAELFSSISTKGDAAKLSLALAMVLGAVSLSDDRLVALSYKVQIDQDALKHIETRLEDAVAATLHLSRLYDGEETIPTIRASMIYGFYLKDKGRIGDVVFKRLGEDLVEMIKASNLHRLDDNSLHQQLNSNQVESRRRLFGEFLVHDRMISLVLNQPPTLSLREINCRSPQNTSTSAGLIFRLDLTSILSEARNILKGQIHSYQEVEKIDSKLESLWKHWIEEKGTIQKVLCGTDRARLTDSFVGQISYGVCMVMLHRSSIFNVSAKFDSKSIQKSRKRCFEAALLSVEAQEMMRFSVEADEVISSFRVAWCPSETVISFLLASMMALREALIDQNSIDHSNSNKDVALSEIGYQEAIEMIERAKELADRMRECLKSVPSGSMMAEKSLAMLDRVESKANTLLSSNITPTRAIKSKVRIANDKTGPLGTDVPYYMPTEEDKNTSALSHAPEQSNDDNLAHPSIPINERFNVLRNQYTPLTAQDGSSIESRALLVSKAGVTSQHYLSAFETPEKDIEFWNSFQQKHCPAHEERTGIHPNGAQKASQYGSNLDIAWITKDQSDSVNRVSSSEELTEALEVGAIDTSNAAMESQIDYWIASMVEQNSNSQTRIELPSWQSWPYKDTLHPDFDTYIRS